MLLNEIFQTLFPYPSQCEPLNSPADLVLYMAKRKIFSCRIGSVEFVMIELSDDEKFSVVALKKQLDIYSKYYRKNCGFITCKYEKKKCEAFVRNRIPFVAYEKQVYLPFLGMALTNDFHEERTLNLEAMMPATQELFLYMFINSERRYFLKSEVADALSLSRTSLTRSSRELVAMSLIREEKVGREYRMELLYKGYQLYEKAKKYLINPIVKAVYIDSCNLPSDAVLAGESALASISTLNAPKLECYAINKTSVDLRNINSVDIRWDECDNPVLLQLWKYDPGLFKQNNQVDTISLVCSFMDEQDERIEGAIEEIIVRSGHIAMSEE